MSNEQILDTRRKILMGPQFSSTHNWLTYLDCPIIHPWDCTVQRLAYFVQTKGLAGMGQEFTFAHVGRLNIVEVRMLEVACHFAAKFELLTLKRLR